MAKHLEVTVTAANFKRMDLKAYGIESREAWVKLVLNDQERKTKRVNSPTMDPTFEETFSFEVKDPAKDKLEVFFYLGDTHVGQKADYLLDALETKKHTYKGMAVVGGKVDMMLQALDFGVEPQQQKAEDDSFMEFL